VIIGLQTVRCSSGHPLLASQATPPTVSGVCAVWVLLGRAATPPPHFNGLGRAPKLVLQLAWCRSIVCTHISGTLGL
jgi:hypothetical protein